MALEAGGNIVAYGKIIDVGVQSSKQVIHGVALGEENVRVEIVGIVVHDAKIPIPVSDNEIVTVTDALGSFIPWPRHLIVTPYAVRYKVGQLIITTVYAVRYKLGQHIIITVYAVRY